MTLKDAIDNIAYTLGKSTDPSYKLKLYDDILIARATYIERQVNKGDKSLLLANTVTIECLELEDTTIPECCDEGCKVARTKYDIPAPITFKNQLSGFRYVGSTDAKSPLGYIIPARLPFLFSKFQKLTKGYYTYINKRLYVFDDTDRIRVEYIPSRVDELNLLAGCDGTPCSFNPEVTDDMMIAIKSFVFEEHGVKQSE